MSSTDIMIIDNQLFVKYYFVSIRRGCLPVVDILRSSGVRPRWILHIQWLENCISKKWQMASVTHIPKLSSTAVGIHNLATNHRMDVHLHALWGTNGDNRIGRPDVAPLSL